MPLINENDSLTLLAIIMMIVAFGYWSEKTALSKKLSTPLTLLMLGLILSNIGLIPHSAPVYDTIQSFLIPIAIPLLLFRANLVRVFKESGTMLLAFSLATAFTVIGVFVAAGLVDLGEFESEIVGSLAASYIGGSANLVATAEAIQFTGASAYLPTLTADAIGVIVFLMLIMLLPASSLILKLLPSKHINSNNKSKTENNKVAEVTSHNDTTVTIAGIIYGISLSVIICAVGRFIAGFFDLPGMFIIAITTISLLVANFAKKLVDKINFDFEVGSFFMYVFFVTIGASANVSNVLDLTFYIILFLTIVIIIHIAMLLLFGYFLKLDLAELIVASSACILGPAAAAALAAGQGWKSLVTPGMLVGVLGYAIATFIGIGVTSILS